MPTIGKLIATRRKELGLSQDDLAKKMGYATRSAINKIESGVNDVPTRNVIKFAQALDTTVQYLMGMEDKEEEKKTHNNAMTNIIVRLREDNDFFSLVETLNKVDKKQMKKCRAMLNVLLEQPED